MQEYRPLFLKHTFFPAIVDIVHASSEDRSMRFTLAPLLLSVVLIAACTPTVPGNQVSSNATASQGSTVSPADIQVTYPVTLSKVHSPLVVTGKARGTWYFEASFPVRLLDGNGNELATVPAEAQGDWMTEDFVPFIATLTFSQPSTPTGSLILEKDNPSGDPAHAAQIVIPVQF